jgi:hypothetical protein
MSDIYIPVLPKRTTFEFIVPAEQLEKWGANSLEGFITKCFNNQIQSAVGKKVIIVFNGNSKISIPFFAGVELAKSTARLMDMGIRVEFFYRD